MAVKTEKLNVSDVVLYEAPQKYSRDVETIASGEGVLAVGMVLGRVTASGKLVAAPPASAVGKEGAETAMAVLLEEIDATAADAEAVVMTRQGVVNRANLSFEAGVDTAAERDAKVAELKAAGILARTGA